MNKLEDINESSLDLTGKDFETKACQTSTEFFRVLKTKYGTKKLGQLLDIICKKYPEGAETFQLDCSSNEQDSFRNAEYFKELLLKKSDFYEKFIDFCFEKKLILQDENNTSVVSKEVIKDVSRIISLSGESYGSLLSKESAFELETDELKMELEKFKIENPSEFLGKLFGRFSNEKGLDYLFEKKHLDSIFKEFFRFPSALSDKEIRDKELSRLKFLSYLSSIENGKLWFSLLIKANVFKYFSTNPFVNFKTGEKIEELSKTDNGQFLLATMVDNGIVNKRGIPVGIKKGFHPQLKPDVLTWKDRVKGV